MASSVAVVLNEVDEEATFHCEALADRFPDARRIDYPAGERLDPTGADAVVLTGSTAGVYERHEHPWIDDEIELIRTLVEREIPTLGVCFGHQVVNVALGGSVDPGEMTAGLVSADLADRPLFEGVGPAVPALHGDRVTEMGEGLNRIAAAEHAEIFGTAHRERPVWTVQFHPELDADLTDELAAFDWQTNGFSWAEVSAHRVFENFRRVADA
ncbi:type 1 glutamine amidotransferase [Halovenus sp. HT40]|uniref:type 1 glutamine amidotransferase n=1 Tax=Halovenus sp. HT40 TaxID=3126691 RepID=UPI00300F1AC6